MKPRPKKLKTRPPKPKRGAGSLQRMVRALQNVVEDMTDGYQWNWTAMASMRDAARICLTLLAREQLIEHADHPYGGDIWRVNGWLYGRTDGITHEKFDALKRPNDRPYRPEAEK